MMAKENLIREEAFRFAVKIKRLAQKLRETREFDMASQIWRSGTGIGANVEEAQAAQSRADFISKMSIASKEAREVSHWLRLAAGSGVREEAEIRPLQEDCERLVRILTSIVKTSAIKNQKSKNQNLSEKLRNDYAG
jgi:four helix bundle protein